MSFRRSSASSKIAYTLSVPQSLLTLGVEPVREAYCDRPKWMMSKMPRTACTTYYSSQKRFSCLSPSDVHLLQGKGDVLEHQTKRTTNVLSNLGGLVEIAKKLKTSVLWSSRILRSEHSEGLGMRWTLSMSRGADRCIDGLDIITEDSTGHPGRRDICWDHVVFGVSHGRKG